MTFKKRIEELNMRLAGKPGTGDQDRRIGRTWMTPAEWDEFIEGKPFVIRVHTPNESAYYLEDTSSGGLQLTRLGVEESDAIKAVEKTLTWKPPAISGHGLLANF